MYYGRRVIIIDESLVYFGLFPPACSAYFACWTRPHGSVKWAAMKLRRVFWPHPHTPGGVASLIPRTEQAEGKTSSALGTVVIGFMADLHPSLSN